jgi:DNA-binding NtrC family response regulator
MPRILIIDDSPSTLEAVAMMLDGAGHLVRCCPNGRQAQALLEREPFDLIITDIFMPEEDGLQLILAARRLRPDLPIVAMSGRSGSLDMLPVARRLGACRLLRKPFNKTDLLAVVELALTAAGPAKMARRP